MILLLTNVKRGKTMFIKNKKLLILSIFLIAILAISAGSAAAADIQNDSSSPILMDGDVPTGDDTGGDGPTDTGTNPGGDDPSNPGTNTGGDDPTDPSGDGGETPDPQENTPKETTLTVTAGPFTVGSDVTIEFSLKDSDGANVDGPVILALADHEPTEIQLVEGQGSETFGALPIGQYAYTLTFEGNDDYASSTASGVLEVVGLNSTLTLTVNDITLGQDATIGIELTDGEGNGIDGVVALTVNGQTDNITLSKGKGSKTITSGLTIKNYPITAKFAGDSTYKAASATATLAVTPTYVSNFAELKSALADATVKQIQLKNDIVMTSMITINRATDIIIDGNNKALNGQGKVQLFVIRSTVTMKNLILKGGKASLGGAIDLHGKLTLNNCQFINNTASGSAPTSAAGGAIFTRDGSTLSATGTKFTTNVATIGKGGAVAVRSANAVFNKCTFTSNKAKNGEGGAIASYGKGLKITSCTFKSNSAAATGKAYAGAITLMGQNPNIQSSTFTSNSAKNHAGAILVGKNVLGTVVNKCTFTSNKVTAEDGGAMSWAGGKGSITNCKFTSNYAKQDGGCIDFFNTNGKAAPTITIKNCVFNKNKSTKSAAALFLGVKVKYAISNCNFTSNSKPKYGGAVFFEGASASFSNCNFKSNVASQNGGAISANSGGKISLTKCTFTSNKAYFGGAILNKAKGITVNSCKFTKNTAGRSGGAIAIQGGTNVIKVTTFLSNKAVFGAGIFQGSKTLTVTKCTFTTNKASKSGGAAFIAGGKFKQSKNKFKGNKGGKKPNVAKK